MVYCYDRRDGGLRKGGLRPTGVTACGAACGIRIEGHNMDFYSSKSWRVGSLAEGLLYYILEHENHRNARLREMAR